MLKMTTNYLDLPDGRIAYDDEGDGPLVVCLPPMLEIRSTDRFLRPRLLEAGLRPRWVVDRQGAQLLLLDGGGHHPHIDHPDQVTDAILDFRVAHHR